MNPTTMERIRAMGRRAYQARDFRRAVACTMACSGYPKALEDMQLALDEQQAREDNADGHLDEGQEGGE